MVKNQNLTFQPRLRSPAFHYVLCSVAPLLCLTYYSSWGVDNLSGLDQTLIKAENFWTYFLLKMVCFDVTLIFH